MKRKIIGSAVVVLIILLVTAVSSCGEKSTSIISDKQEVFTYLTVQDSGDKVDCPEGYKIVGLSSFYDQDEEYYLMNESHAEDNDVYVLENGKITKKLEVMEGFTFCGAASSVGRQSGEDAAVDSTACLLENDSTGEVRQYAIKTEYVVTTQYE